MQPGWLHMPKGLCFCSLKTGREVRSCAMDKGNEILQLSSVLLTCEKLYPSPHQAVTPSSR